MNFPEITLVVASYNEENYIDKCLDSILKQNYQGKIHLIISDGGSTDKTIEISKTYSDKFEDFLILENTGRIQSIGRNIAINYCKTDFIAYLDSHCVAHTDWLSTLYSKFTELEKTDKNIAGIGTSYQNASETEFSSSYFAAVSSWICGSGPKHLLNRDKIEKINHAVMCLYYKPALIKAGLYDETMVIGEDIELNCRLNRKGYSLYFVPEHLITYYPRENFSELFRQKFNYGYWRHIVNTKCSKFQLFSYLPAVFVSVMVLLFVFSFFNSVAFALYYTFLVIYVFTLLTASAVIGLRKKVNPILMAVIFAIIHWGYGLGTISSLLNIKLKKNVL